MATIVQLSDLHLSLAEEQKPILDALVDVLEQRFSRAGRRADLLVLTGDVFDSAQLQISRAVEAFCALYDRLVEALGRDVPTVIIPGNHDRRRWGFVGPHDGRLFRALGGALNGRVFVHGNEALLGAVVPRAYHKLPLSLIAYDSAYLPSGLFGAGGVVRQEDLLHAAARIEDAPSGEPLVFLVHHHLVPTPLTDVGSIGIGSTRGALRWLVRKFLPSVIANADREELTMTALGAGTALSTLHEIGRAVLVLHGHKHYATARMLHAMIDGQGDVLIVSAGSCGVAEPWSPTTNRDGARLWPSFNVIDLDGSDVHAQTVSFGYKGHSAARYTRRELAHARKENRSWHVAPVALAPVSRVGPTLSRNHRLCRLSRSRRNRARWDYECVRSIDGTTSSPQRYVEVIDRLPGSRLFIGRDRVLEKTTSARLELHRGVETIYRVEEGLCRTIAESTRVNGRRSSPYEWLGLMNRYTCDEVRLRVEGLGASSENAFGSITDLGTGIEQPLHVARSTGDAIEAVVRASQARTLVRIYFPLLTRGSL